MADVQAHMLSEQVSVSPQLESNQISAVASAGVEVLVCNRPDNEEPNQPLFTDIQAEAIAQGLEVIHIPFAGGQMTQEHVEAFANVMKTGKRIHAYCRSGTRCTHLWNAASALLSE